MCCCNLIVQNEFGSFDQPKGNIIYTSASGTGNIYRNNCFKNTGIRFDGRQPLRPPARCELNIVFNGVFELQDCQDVVGNLFVTTDDGIATVA